MKDVHDKPKICLFFIKADRFVLIFEDNLAGNPRFLSDNRHGSLTSRVPLRCKYAPDLYISEHIKRQTTHVSYLHNRSYMSLLLQCIPYLLIIEFDHDCELTLITLLHY